VKNFSLISLADWVKTDAEIKKNRPKDKSKCLFEVTPGNVEAKNKACTENLRNEIKEKNDYLNQVQELTMKMSAMDKNLKDAELEANDNGDNLI